VNFAGPVDRDADGLGMGFPSDGRVRRQRPAPEPVLRHTGCPHAARSELKLPHIVLVDAIDSEVKRTYYRVVSTAASVAAFSADCTRRPRALTIQFTDQSTGNPTAWAWILTRNGTVDSITKNPHTLMMTLAYTVMLTVTTQAGSDSGMTADYVRSANSRHGAAWGVRHRRPHDAAVVNVKATLVHQP